MLNFFFKEKIIGTEIEAPDENDVKREERKKKMKEFITKKEESKMEK